MGDEIIYVGFYAPPGLKYKRYAAPSAINKMDYIADALVRAGFLVHFISPSWITDAHAKWSWTQQLENHPSTRVTLCPSFGTNRKWVRYLKVALSLFWLFLQLLKHAKKGSPVLVYHSPVLSLPVCWAKRFKLFKLVLEVEEIYSERWGSVKFDHWEQDLLAGADHFIAISELLAQRLGPRVDMVSYGRYKINFELPLKSKSDTIHLVYAGSTDAVNSCVVNAIGCLSHLPDRYTLHLCLFGEEKYLVEANDKCKKINSDLGRQACVFHGTLQGSALSTLLASCDIGINPQVISSHLETALPSKVLVYMCHNLRVVTTRMKNIENTTISHLLTYSEEATSLAIARAIESVDLSAPYDSRGLLLRHDEQFVRDLQRLMKGSGAKEGRTRDLVNGADESSQ